MGNNSHPLFEFKNLVRMCSNQGNALRIAGSHPSSTKKDPLRSFKIWGGRTHLAALAFDVSPLEPYLSCRQLEDKAQGSALGSLALEP